MAAVHQVNRGLWSADIHVHYSLQDVFLCICLCMCVCMCICVERKERTGYIRAPEIVRAMTELFFVVENLAEVGIPSLYGNSCLFCI